MHAAALCSLVIAGCGTPTKPSKHTRYPDLPVEAERAPDAGADEPLPFVPIESSDQPPIASPRPAPTGSPSIPAAACIPAGRYAVEVDLSSAKVAQANTGMSDLTWCKSILEGVPKTAMATLEIKVAGGQLSLEWPPGQPARLAVRDTCSFDVTSPPMVSTITFANRKATGTTSYAVGSPNHPDESCSAVNATLALEPIR